MKEWQPSSDQSKVFEKCIELIYTEISKYRKMSAIDIGSHRGRHTKVLQNLYKYVYAFDAIDNKIKYNHNVKFYNTALHNKHSNVKFNIVQGTGLSSIYYEPENTTSKEYIDTTVLDDYNLQDIAFIKIDAEGNEFNILYGSKNTLLNNSPVIYIEGSQKYYTDVFNQYLDTLNYEIFSMNKPQRSYKINEKLTRDNLLIHRGDKLKIFLFDICELYTFEHSEYYTRWL